MLQRIAIIGAGPAGCALACFLAERGIECLLYDDEKKPALLVGESLIPAAIPHIRRLGIEDQVAEMSQLKMGAALRHSSGSPRVDFAFQKLGRGVPEYAYNIPRPQFDKLVRQRAQQLGAKIISHKAGVERNDNDESHELQLDERSLKAAGLCRATQPDFLVDATGRARLFSRVLKIPATRGPRNDVAHFAHFNNFASDSAFDGQIVISVLNCGWSWQIPLKGKTSVGVVFNKEAAEKYGKTAEERLTNVMQQNPVLNKIGFDRISDVQTYSNYQLVSNSGHGKGWVLLGDALGFVDPMLSPGVFLSLESASQLDKILFSSTATQPTEKAELLDKYYDEMTSWYAAWATLIEYFYDGRLLSLGEMHSEIHASHQKFSFGKLAEPFISNIIARLISGAGTRSKFNKAALTQTCNALTTDLEMLAKYSIKSNFTASSTPKEMKVEHGATPANGGTLSASTDKPLGTQL